jgi:hypothetical protein
MILCDHGKVETKSDDNDEEMLPLKNVSDDDVEYLVKGESHVIRRALNAQAKNYDLV